MDHASIAKAIIGLNMVAKSRQYVISVEEKVIFKNSVIEYHLIREETIDKIKGKLMNVIWAINIDLTTKVLKTPMTRGTRRKELLRRKLIFVATSTRVQKILGKTRGRE